MEEAFFFLSFEGGLFLGGEQMRKEGVLEKLCFLFFSSSFASRLRLLNEVMC